MNAVSSLESVEGVSSLLGSLVSCCGVFVMNLYSNYDLVLTESFVDLSFVAVYDL